MLNLLISLYLAAIFKHCTEVRFATFLSGGFTTIAVINPPERKLAKRTSVQCMNPTWLFGVDVIFYDLTRGSSILGWRTSLDLT